MSKQQADRHSGGGPLAVVTGANRGIGLGVVAQLVDSGYQVILGSRDLGKGRAAAGGRRNVTAEQLDVTDPASIDAFVRGRADAGTPVDVVVNNAAVALDGFDKTVARRTIDTNFYAPIRLTDAIRPNLAPGARVVMVSSGAGELSILSPELQRRFTDPALDRAALFELVETFIRDVAAGRHSQAGWPSSCYGVSKAALNAFVRISAAELSKSGIAINAVCPGWVRTDMGGADAPLTVETGARSVVFAALLDAASTGGFYRDGAPIDW